MSKIDFETIERTCYMCPSQWEGKLEDGKRMFYARLRHGYFYVEYSDGPADSVMDFHAGKNAKIVLEFDHPTSDGFMTNFEFYRTLLRHNLLTASPGVLFVLKYFGGLLQKLEDTKDRYEWRKNVRRISKRGFFWRKGDED